MDYSYLMSVDTPMPDLHEDDDIDYLRATPYLLKRPDMDIKIFDLLMTVYHYKHRYSYGPGVSETISEDLVAARRALVAYAIEYNKTPRTLGDARISWWDDLNISIFHDRGIVADDVVAINMHPALIQRVVGGVIGPRRWEFFQLLAARDPKLATLGWFYIVEGGVTHYDIHEIPDAVLLTVADLLFTQGQEVPDTLSWLKAARDIHAAS